MTPSTGGLLAQTSPRANESLRGGLSSSGDSAMPVKGPCASLFSPPLLETLSPEALGVLKLTDSPLRNFGAVFTVREGLCAFCVSGDGASLFLSAGELFANGTAKRPSSESSSESSCCSSGVRWKETCVSSKSNSGP